MGSTNTKADALAMELDNLQPVVLNKIDHYFGERPDVLASIIKARKRKLSYGQIAKVLSKGLPAGESIKDQAVKGWLEKNGEA